MSTLTDPRFEAYLEKAAAFARPILEHFREVVHDVCPNVQETLKWSQAAFVYRGKILCVMGVFKAHCRVHFWNSERLLATVGNNDEEKLGRLTQVTDLPNDANLRRYLEAAVESVDSGEPPPVREGPAIRKAELPIPAAFAALLKKAPAAKKTLENLAPGQRREYLVWITEAKREETRIRRMATAVEWLAEGKLLNWKYENC